MQSSWFSQDVTLINKSEMTQAVYESSVSTEDRKLSDAGQKFRSSCVPVTGSYMCLCHEWKQT